MFLFRDSLPDMKGKMRLLHAAAGAKAIDIYVDGNILATNLDFGEITSYQDISPGKHEFKIFAAGKSTNPLFTDTYEIIPNEIVTMSAVLLESTLTLFALKDNPPKGIQSLAYLRFINFSPNSPLLTLSLPGGDTLFNGVEYLETTGFYPLSAGLYNFIMTATNDPSFKKFINDIQLEPDSDHTIFVIGLVDDKPQLGFLITDDKIV